MTWLCNKVQPASGVSKFRDIEQNGDYSHHTNAIVTSKYTILSFIPKLLFEQFVYRLSNAYFLIVCICQSIKAISATNGRPTMAFPLAVVIGIQAVTTAVEDYRRHKADEAENNAKALSFSRETNTFKDARWADLKMGTIIKILENEPVPADVVFLASKPKDQGNADPSMGYVTTAQLDGETSLKTKRALLATSSVITKDEDCGKFTLQVKSEMPNKYIHKFTGTLVTAVGDKETKDLLDIENVLLRGSILKSVESAYGFVINTGPETKVMQSLSLPQAKQSISDTLMNHFIVRVVGFMAGLCLLAAICNTAWSEGEGLDHWYLMIGEEDLSPFGRIVIKFFTFFVILAQLLPISIYVSANVVKLFQSNFIRWDQGMQYTREDGEEVVSMVRTLELNGDLGQVNYIFADKTGTLTSNRMEFHKLLVKNQPFGLSHPLQSQNDAFLEGKRNIFGVTKRDGVFRAPHVNFIDDPQASLSDTLCGVGAGAGGASQRDAHLMMLNVCMNHSCLIDHPEGEPDVQPDLPDISAESPDEQAYVEFAALMGYRFEGRHRDGTIYLNVAGAPQHYKVLCSLDYTSERRRMSIVFRRADVSSGEMTGPYYLVTKGADSEIHKRLSEESRSANEDGFSEANEWAAEGLRVLWFAGREVPDDEATTWLKNYDDALRDLTEVSKKKDGEPNLIDELMDQFERNFDFMGACANEDKLQEEVPETIENLRKAGIKVWMVTGDKTSTAYNIALATRLLDPSMPTLDLATHDADKLRSLLKDEVKHIEEEEQQLNSEREETRLHRDTVTVRPHAHKSTHTHPQTTDSLPDQAPPEEGVRVVRKLSLVSFNQRGLIIDEGALDVALADKEMANDLITVARNCSAVVASRMRPDQKKAIVKLIYARSKTIGGTEQEVTLAIGDGANDVDMIQTAHIGVAILGKEGRQAANASDYAVPRFRHLGRLLLVHGRYNYRRLSKLLGYQFYKTFVFKMPQFWYSCFCAFSGQKLYVEVVEILYNVLFCTVPILCYGSWDRDVTVKTAIQYPALYRPGRHKELINSKVMFNWTVNATFHSLIAFFVPLLGMYMLLDDQGHIDIFELGSVVISVVVVVVNVKVFLEIHLKYWVAMITIVGSVCLWFITAFFMDVGPGELHGFVRHMAAAPAPWLVMFIACVAALTRDLWWKGYLRAFRPELYHLLQEREMLGLEPPKMIAAPGLKGAVIMQDSNEDLNDSPEDDKKTDVDLQAI